jgi:large subunit ribosomal protein L25
VKKHLPKPFFLLQFVRFLIKKTIFKNYQLLHMEKLVLNAELRSTEEKLSEVRAEKMVPAIVYGQEVAATVIKLNYSEFLKTFRKSGQENAIELTVDGKTLNVMVKEVQRNPVTGDFLHVDFFAAK